MADAPHGHNETKRESKAAAPLRHFLHDDWDHDVVDAGADALQRLGRHKRPRAVGELNQEGNRGAADRDGDERNGHDALVVEPVDGVGHEEGGGGLGQEPEDHYGAV